MVAEFFNFMIIYDYFSDSSNNNNNKIQFLKFSNEIYWNQLINSF